MERLTNWMDEETKTEVSITHYKMREAMIRLAAYEDTGLTPEEIMDGKMLTGWIPVEERLPECKGEYLVSYHPCYWDSVENDICTGIDTFRGKSTWAKKKYQRVIAWMKLPEPFRPKLLQYADNDTAQLGLMPAT